MKFLNFQSFSQLAELASRQNGKTYAAVKEALNVLLNKEGPATVMIVTYNQSMRRYLGQVTEELLRSVRSTADVCMISASLDSVEFSSFSGRKRLVFGSFTQNPDHLFRGKTFEDVIFDISPDIMFKDRIKFDEFFRCLAPIMAKNS